MRPAPFRAARGSAVACVGVALAAVAHGGAGGAVPGLPLVLAGAVALAGCVVAAQRAWTLGRLLIALVAIQTIVHGFLWITASDQPVDPRLAGLSSPLRVPLHDHAAMAPSSTMLAAHVAAAVVAALLLAGVDDAVLTVWALGRAVLGARPVAVALPGARGVAAAPAVRVRPRTRGLLVSPRRGPPMATAAC